MPPLRGMKASTSTKNMRPPVDPDPDPVPPPSTNSTNNHNTRDKIHKFKRSGAALWDLILNEQRNPKDGLWYTRSTDVHLMCRNGYVPAHAAILGNASAFFCAMFESQGNNDTIHGPRLVLMPDYGMFAIRKILQVIYTGVACVKSEREAEKIQDLAVSLGVGLTEEVVSFEFGPAESQGERTSKSKKKIILGYRMTEKGNNVFNYLANVPVSGGPGGLKNSTSNGRVLLTNKRVSCVNLNNVQSTKKKTGNRVTVYVPKPVPRPRPPPPPPSVNETLVQNGNPLPITTSTATIEETEMTLPSTSASGTRAERTQRDLPPPPVAPIPIEIDEAEIDLPPAPQPIASVAVQNARDVHPPEPLIRVAFKRTGKIIPHKSPEKSNEKEAKKEKDRPGPSRYKSAGTRACPKKRRKTVNNYASDDPDDSDYQGPSKDLDEEEEEEDVGDSESISIISSEEDQYEYDSQSQIEEVEVDDRGSSSSEVETSDDDDDDGAYKSPSKRSTRNSHSYYNHGPSHSTNREIDQKNREEYDKHKHVLKNKDSYSRHHQQDRYEKDHDRRDRDSYYYSSNRSRGNYYYNHRESSESSEDDEEMESDPGSDDSDSVHEPTCYDKPDVYLEASKTCTRCKKVYPSHQGASKCATEEHNRLRCYFCFSTCKSQKALYRHYGTRHNGSSNSGGRIYCPICSAKVAYKEASIHVLTFHLTSPKVVTTVRTGGPSTSASATSGQTTATVRTGGPSTSATSGSTTVRKGGPSTSTSSTTTVITGRRPTLTSSSSTTTVRLSENSVKTRPPPKVVESSSDDDDEEEDDEGESEDEEDDLDESLVVKKNGPEGNGKT